MRAGRCCAAVLMLLVSAAAASAQTIDIRPLLLLEENPVPGIRIATEYAQTRVLIGPYPKNWYWHAFADAPLFTKADRNRETLRAQIDGGLQISLFRPSLPAPGQPPSPDDPPPWNYGFVALQLGVGAEAPQNVRTADVTLGASLAYEHDQYHSLWFIPELRIAYDAVFCIDCNDAATLEHSGDTGWRANGDIGWNIPADRAWVPA
ncbi:MAG TPA: hypothetical protein VHG09_05210, partial [Longimicrobiales bacterium]|nr:hypothetical protein [Longimicrobiales bacterium]